jgi:hypothetical protein
MNVALTVTNPRAVPGFPYRVDDGHVRLAVSQTRQVTGPGQEGLTCAGIPGLAEGLV